MCVHHIVSICTLFYIFHRPTFWGLLWLPSSFEEHIWQVLSSVDSIVYCVWGSLSERKPEHLLCLLYFPIQMLTTTYSLCWRRCMRHCQYDKDVRIPVEDVAIMIAIYWRHFVPKKQIFPMKRVDHCIKLDMKVTW